MLWRAAGLTYVRYSEIAAALTRKCLKDAAKDVAKRGQATLKVTRWEAGKPVKPST